MALEIQFHDACRCCRRRRPLAACGMTSAAKAAGLSPSAARHTIGQREGRLELHLRKRTVRVGSLAGAGVRHQAFEVEPNQHVPCAQYSTTERIDSPLFIKSKPSLMRSRGKRWVIRSSMLSLPSIYQSTIFGTSVRPRAPPKAEPRHSRPVTSWNGRVEISWPAAATPIMNDLPQPLWVHSSAWRIKVVLPTHSNE